MQENASDQIDVSNSFLKDYTTWSNFEGGMWVYGLKTSCKCKMLNHYNPGGACTSYENPTLCLTLQTVRWLH